MKLLIMLTITSLLLTVPGPINAQDGNDVSSRRESAAIESVEKAGGRVYRISQADSSREVSFYLAGEPVVDDQLKDLSAINNIIWLNLAGSKVTVEGLKQIEGMKLKKLHLERSTITDKAMEIVKSQKELTYLNLYGTAVTDKGLTQLSELKNLRKLYVWQTKVTEEGIKSLQEKLPELKIIGECKLIPVPKPEEKKETKKDEAKKDDSKKDNAKKEEAKSEEAKPDKPADKQGDEKKEDDK